MDIMIDEQWLKDQGIEAEGQEAEELIDLAMDELELRIGSAISEKLTRNQMAEFDAIEDEDERVDWLEKSLPDFTEMAEKEFTNLTNDVQKSKDKTKLIRSWAAAD